MKNKKILFFSLLFLFFIIILSNTSMAKDLDLIHNYTITVNPRSDGSLDMIYHLEWEVLDSTSEGPLTWVKIGIPNSNVNGIQATSSNIKSIKYYQDNGDYIRIDFNKEYYESDIISFDFKFHQSYMYELTLSTCNYTFIPGWFNDIKVEKLTVLWNAKNVTKSNSKSLNSDNYLVWNTSLSKGKKYKITVSYPTGVFNTSTEKQSSYASVSTNQNSNNNYIKIFIVIFAIIIVLSILSSFTGFGYYSHGGYGYDYGYRHYHHHSLSSHKSSYACVSSCACACACAGGGRAGCSKKDFYGKNLKTKQLNKILNK